MPSLTTGRLQIDFFTLDDAPFILKLLNTPSWLKFIGDRDVNNLEEAKDYLQYGPIRSYEKNGFGLYKLSLHNGEPIGMCGFLKRKDLSHPDIGFALLPEHVGNGYIFEAGKELLDHAKNKLKLSVIMGITVPDNTKSINIMNKLGLKYVKKIKISGEKITMNLYSTKTET